MNPSDFGRTSIQSIYGISIYTKTNMEPENAPLQKETFSTKNTTFFGASMLVFGGVFVEQHVYRNILLEFQDSTLHNLWKVWCFFEG